MQVLHSAWSPMTCGSIIAAMCRYSWTHPHWPNDNRTNAIGCAKCCPATVWRPSKHKGMSTVSAHCTHLRINVFFLAGPNGWPASSRSTATKWDQSIGLAWKSVSPRDGAKRISGRMSWVVHVGWRCTSLICGDSASTRWRAILRLCPSADPLRCSTDRASCCASWRSC